MALVGRLHPLLIHFPIALVIVAALAEVVAMVTADDRWRTVAVGNVRAGAVFALLATFAGWCLALAPEMEGSPLLEWHRWLGTMAAGAALAAALATGGIRRQSALGVLTYRIALFAAGTLVAVTGHFGGLLVWGANFLHP
jgi:uncharacterized membrane protein